MNIIFVGHDLFANIKGWLRSPGTVFWTVLFPILLILIFGAIFSTSDEIELDLVVQDYDESLILQAINIMKPIYMTLTEIIFPEEEPDHLILGISQLNENWILH